MRQHSAKPPRRPESRLRLSAIGDGVVYFADAPKAEPHPTTRNQQPTTGDYGRATHRTRNPRPTAGSIRAAIRRFLVPERLDFCEPWVIVEDVEADFDALVADENLRTGDQLFYLMLILVAKAAPYDSLGSVRSVGVPFLPEHRFRLDDHVPSPLRRQPRRRSPRHRGHGERPTRLGDVPPSAINAFSNSPQSVPSPRTIHRLRASFGMYVTRPFNNLDTIGRAFVE